MSISENESCDEHINNVVQYGAVHAMEYYHVIIELYLIHNNLILGVFDILFKYFLVVQRLKYDL